MWNNFFKHIDIDPANAHILDGNAQNLEEECQAYEQKIAEAGGIELFVGGQTCGFWYRLHSSGMQTICESVVTADCGCFTTLLLLLLFLSLHKWSGVFLLGYY